MRFGTIRQKRWMCALILLAGCATLSGCHFVNSITQAFTHPPKPFNATPAPAEPNYAESRAWMAFPGRNGAERSTTPGVRAIDEKTAAADVFFIHPTTYLKNDVWNAAYDVNGPYNYPVLLGQVSAFNGCCRIFAPHYRQSSLTGLKNPQAVQLAYGDVARAFRYYIAHENHGRPFIIASHSQGTRLTVQLLQTEILGTPLRKQLVAVYAIGSYVPSNFGELGLPVCENARQTGCIVSWNASKTGRTGAMMMVHNAAYWWKGAERQSGNLPAVCVNPLTWTENGAAPAAANAGSLAFPAPPFPAHAITLPPLWPHLTGAVCKDKLLDADIPISAPEGYNDMLAFLYGSYHRNEYGMFYAAIRQNAIDRVASFVKRP